MLITEVCKLRMWDIDRDQVRIQGPDVTEMWMPLGANGLHHLLWYLGQTRLNEAKAQTGGGVLFLLERRRSLTPNAITLLFLRLSSRAGMSEKGATPSALRDAFAVRYLQQGRKLHHHQEQLRLADPTSVRRYQHFCDEQRRGKQ